MFVLRDSDDVNWSGIDLNADYSDSDDEVPIEEKKFWEYFQKLEENNLFEMNLFQDRTQTLEKMEKECQAKIAVRKRKIEELDNNIALLQQSLGARNDRYSYYQNMLIDSNKPVTSKAAAATRGGKPKSTGTKDRAKAPGQEEQPAGASGLGMTATAGGFGAAAGKKGFHQTALNQHLYSLGATRDEVKSINEGIYELIECAKDKQEEMGEREVSRKIMTENEMIVALKKVEIKFQELVELRKVYQFFDEKALKEHEQAERAKKRAQNNAVLKNKVIRAQEKKQEKM